MRFIIAALLTGFLFGIMDGIIHANAYAIHLMECYQPIARQSVSLPAALAIDLLYGFAISGIFLLIRSSLPTETGFIKGMIYGIGIWFFRVLMNVLSDWTMFDIPTETLVYVLWTGLIEMIILGLINGLILKKSQRIQKT